MDRFLPEGFCGWYSRQRVQNARDGSSIFWPGIRSYGSPDPTLNPPDRSKSGRMGAMSREGRGSGPWVEVWVEVWVRLAGVIWSWRDRGKIREKGPEWGRVDPLKGRADR